MTTRLHLLPALLLALSAHGHKVLNMGPSTVSMSDNKTRTGPF